MSARLLLLCAAASSLPDDLWLRYDRIGNETYRSMLLDRIERVAVVGDAPTCSDKGERARLDAASAELGDALSSMLGRATPTSCCDATAAAAAEEDATLVLSVGAAYAKDAGAEGFAISDLAITAGSASGALYGAFRFLSFVQRREPLPRALAEAPSMTLRVWDLWDNLNGHIERGFGGNSFVWPYALFDPARPPVPRQLYLAPCNASDALQQWNGTALEQNATASSLVFNRGASACISTATELPISVGDCDDEGAASIRRNASQLVLESSGKCLDVNGGSGPDVDAYKCHPPSHKDHAHQEFTYDDGLLRSVSSEGNCVTLLNAPPFPDGELNPWEEHDFMVRTRLALRLLKSAGVNGVALNNVNSCGDNARLLESKNLANISANLAPLFEEYGIAPYFSACYASPFVFANLTCDPADPAPKAWWQDKVDELYGLWPGFGGFVIKADSEGNQGPQAYNATEADGANMIADALAPHGGIVMWRAFVYGDGDIGLEDRAKQAYDTFVPLDGQFADNVVVQIKNGPMDFQVREPISPLLAGALNRTSVMMEVQAAQEYTGQQIHAVSLVPQWESYLSFDTGRDGATVRDLLSRSGLRGMASVSNMGNFANWTGHVLAGSNIFGFGRIAWDPWLSSDEIHREFAAMTFPSASDASPGVIDTVSGILQKSWAAFEGYTSPYGIGFIVAGGDAGGNCAPATDGPGPGPEGADCPTSPLEPQLAAAAATGALGDIAGGDHYWPNPCSNYGYSNYSSSGIGCDRTSRGTGYAAQYAPALRAMFDDPATCPLELILFFHNLPWDWTGPNGDEPPLFDRILEGHTAALGQARAMADAWDTLEGVVDDDRFEAVQMRFAQQLNDAAVFSEVITEYYAQLAQS